MNNIQKELDQAFSLLSAISVNGENVDRMAMAKQHLRAAFKLAGEKKEAEADGR